jgi:hypothetical protein
MADQSVLARHSRFRRLSDPLMNSLSTIIYFASFCLCAQLRLLAMTQ